MLLKARVELVDLVCPRTQASSGGVVRVPQDAGLLAHLLELKLGRLELPPLGVAGVVAGELPFHHGIWQASSFFSSSLNFLHNSVLCSTRRSHLNLFSGETGRIP